MSDRAPFRFDIPPGAEPKSCMSCGARIFWVETRSGKRAPVNPDGLSHFSTCKDAEKYRGSSRAELRDQGELFGAKK